jgi:hypothetical protein
MIHRLRTDPAPIRLPQPPAANPSPAGFVCCPQFASPEQWMALQWIYRVAFEQAQAVARPSLPERDLCGVWN